MRSFWSDPHRWRVVVATAALATLLGPLGWVFSQAARSGPLAPPLRPGFYTSTGFPVDHRGEVFTFAQFPLDNRGASPVTIDRVVLVPPRSGMTVRLLSAFVVRQTSTLVYPEVAGPPGQYFERMQPARGSAVPARGTGSYTLGVVVSAPPGFHHASRADEFAVAEGIKVYYHAGRTAYVDSWPTQIVLCHGACTTYARDAWPDPPVRP